VLDVLGMKRRRSDADDRDRCKPKRRRTGSRGELLEFSDEILLKILSFLGPPQLTVVER
jgi:hypothetical protein